MRKENNSLHLEILKKLTALHKKYKNPIDEFTCNFVSNEFLMSASSELLITNAINTFNEFSEIQKKLINTEPTDNDKIISIISLIGFTSALILKLENLSNQNQLSKEDLKRQINSCIETAIEKIYHILLFKKEYNEEIIPLLLNNFHFGIKHEISLNKETLKKIKTIKELINPPVSDQKLYCLNLCIDAFYLTLKKTSSDIEIDESVVVENINKQLERLKTLTSEATPFKLPETKEEISRTFDIIFIILQKKLLTDSLNLNTNKILKAIENFYKSTLDDDNYNYPELKLIMEMEVNFLYAEYYVATNNLDKAIEYIKLIKENITILLPKKGRSSSIPYSIFRDPLDKYKDLKPYFDKMNSTEFNEIFRDSIVDIYSIIQDSPGLLYFDTTFLKPTDYLQDDSLQGFHNLPNIPFFDFSDTANQKLDYEKILEEISHNIINKELPNYDNFNKYLVLIQLNEELDKQDDKLLIILCSIVASAYQRRKEYFWVSLLFSVFHMLKSRINEKSNQNSNSIIPQFQPLEKPLIVAMKEIIHAVCYCLYPEPWHFEEFDLKTLTILNRMIITEKLIDAQDKYDQLTGYLGLLAFLHAKELIDTKSHQENSNIAIEEVFRNKTSIENLPELLYQYFLHLKEEVIDGKMKKLIVIKIPEKRSEVEDQIINMKKFLGQIKGTRIQIKKISQQCKLDVFKKLSSEIDNAINELNKIIRVFEGVIDDFNLKTTINKSNKNKNKNKNKKERKPKQSSDANGNSSANRDQEDLPSNPNPSILEAKKTIVKPETKTTHNPLIKSVDQSALSIVDEKLDPPITKNSAPKETADDNKKKTLTKKIEGDIKPLPDIKPPEANNQKPIPSTSVESNTNRNNNDNVDKIKSETKNKAKKKKKERKPKQSANANGHSSTNLQALDLGNSPQPSVIIIGESTTEDTVNIGKIHLSPEKQKPANNQKELPSNPNSSTLGTKKTITKLETRTTNNSLTKPANTSSNKQPPNGKPNQQQQPCKQKCPTHFDQTTPSVVEPKSAPLITKNIAPQKTTDNHEKKILTKKIEGDIKPLSDIKPPEANNQKPIPSTSVESNTNRNNNNNNSPTTNPAAFFQAHQKKVKKTDNTSNSAVTNTSPNSKNFKTYRGFSAYQPVIPAPPAPVGFFRPSAEESSCYYPVIPCYQPVVPVPVIPYYYYPLETMPEAGVYFRDERGALQFRPFRPNLPPNANEEPNPDTLKF